MSADRKAFEEWADLSYLLARDHVDDDLYAHYPTQQAWEAWQAATEQAAWPQRVRLTDTTACVPHEVGDIVNVIPQQMSCGIVVEGGWVLYPGTWEPVRE